MDLGYCIKQHQLHHKEADTQRSSNHNLKENDADDSSTMSKNSHFFSGFDSETMPAPVSVRDMINRYNSAFKTGGTQPVRRQSQFTLSSAKSSFFGINKFSLSNHIKGDQKEDENAKTPVGCRRCNSVRNVDGCNKPPAGGIVRSGSLSSDQCRCSLMHLKSNCCVKTDQEENSEKPHDSSAQLDNKELSDVLMKASPNLLPSDDLLEEVNNSQSIESSYQSKTTIAKTSSGVRIIIDIFFDQEQNVDAADVIGSRVETDIPESRILSEFQEQSMRAPRSMQS